MVTTLSLIPLPEMPLEELNNDKVQHLLSYTALALPVAVVRPGRWGLMLVGFAAWSAAIEVVQPYVNRVGDWHDWVANVAGLLLAIALSTGIRRLP